MSATDIESMVLDVVSRHAPNANTVAVRREARLKAELGIDSLVFVLILFDLQEELGIEFVGTGFSTQNVTSVADLVEACRVLRERAA